MNNDVLNQVIDDYKVLYHTEKEKRQLLQQRIDKAIEYIKENKIEGFDEDGYSDAYYDYIYVRDLLNILEGDDK